MKLEDVERLGKVVIERTRSLYQEPDMLVHYSDPDRDLAGGAKAYARSMAEQYVRKGGHILVVGCAGGLEAFWFAEDGFEVTGIDIVPQFIDVARQHAKTKGFENCTRFEAVDGFRWPFEDKVFDGVSMMQNLVTHLPTRGIRKTVFAECSRVLRSGGVVMMQAPDRTHPGLTAEKLEWEPGNPEDVDKKRELNLSKEPGVLVDRLHPCKGDALTQTTYPRYEADPDELTQEIQSFSSRVIRVQRDENPKSRWPTVIVVARKD